MAHIPEGDSSPEGDDDKIYLFFSETAVEYDSYTKVDVSRVARVCKVNSLGVIFTCLTHIENHFLSTPHMTSMQNDIIFFSFRETWVG